MDDPSDEVIEAGLAAAPSERWHELAAAADALAAEAVHEVWKGGPETQVVDGEAQEIVHMPYVEYSDAVHRVHAAIGGVGAIVPFPWRQWDGLERYRGGRGLDDAPVADAVRLLTAIIRADRFTEGTLGVMIDDGTVAAAIQRLRRWFDSR